MKKLDVNFAKPSEQQLNSLLEHYQTGRYAEAEKLATSITQEFPEHQFAWKVLGAVLKKTVRVNESLIAMQKSVQLDPQDAETHTNLGVILQELGRSDEAKESYKQAIKLKPDYAAARNNLGVILQELGRSDEAKESYEQAIKLKPDYAEAHNNLGIILQELGRSDEAKESYEQAIKLKPDYAEAHNNLGITLQKLGRLDEAKESYEQAIKLKPDYAEAYINLGITLKKLGRLNEAETSYRKAITLKPDHAEAHNNLGGTFNDLGRLDEAKESYEQAIKLKPDYNDAHYNLGITLQKLGRLVEAKESYEQAIKLKPDNAEAHLALTLIKKFNVKDEQYSKILNIYLDKNTSEKQRCYINFGLAKVYEDLGDFKNAFAHYSEGNALRKKMLNYDINQDVEHLNKIKLNYPSILQNSLKFENIENNLIPVFIVGMPRSGTTLVEQIISSHSQVTGAGELAFVSQFGLALAKGSADKSTDSLINFRNKYLTKLQNIMKGNLIVTDKMPNNFCFIGLITAAFPEAKIIHVKRNAAAVCWGNYKQCFKHQSTRFSYALEDIVNYYKLYQNLMEFWESSLKDRIYNLEYELLVDNQERETRQLINYLGLDWDEKCLSPQNNTRSVSTASNTQVRKKIYQGSSQQWKKYQPFLNGVLDGL